jgi:hypothetical protein
MESIGSTFWFLAFLVQYGALVAGVVSVGAIVVSTVYEVVRNKVRASGMPGSAPVQQPVEGRA